MSKKIISANIDKEIADKLNRISSSSNPKIPKSSLVEYAISLLDENMFKGGNNEKDTSEKRTKKTS